MSLEPYMNRELSWLKFNERVLDEAASEKTPFCERLSFAHIYQNNLDEFFMVRVGSLVDQISVQPDARENKTFMTPAQQLDAVLERVHELNAQKDAVYEQLMDGLNQMGVSIVNFHKIQPEESKSLRNYFNAEIAPLLSPIIVSKLQPFPFLRNKELYAAAVLEKKSGKTRIGIVPCGSGVFPRLISVSGAEKKYILSEELILHYLPEIFTEYKVKSKCLIRVTRNADIDADALYDEDLDYREFMADLIRKRRRLEPVRLELSRMIDKEMVRVLRSYTKVSRNAVFLSSSPLDLSFLSQVQDDLRQYKDLFYEKRVPQRSPNFVSSRPIIEQVREKDKLLCYPYDRMKPFLQMLHEAASDPTVVSIKMTLYRVAKNSEVVESLIEAAENGKEVLVLVELKARFDEENNIAWSRRLEEAGCTVIYGLDGFKVHSKLCLISRRLNGQLEYCTQIGTGNYNEKTARLYTDYSLMTCNQAIGRDASNVLQALSMGDTVKQSQELLVAPNCLQNRVLEMMDAEIAHAADGDAYIGVKINSLTDKKIIEKLIEASKAGVKIELVVRGICCLIPNIPNETENIRIISIVGRYLEHSRVYIFGTGEREKMYIASADFMTRNTLRRVEVAVPILDADLQKQIKFMWHTMLADNCQARELQNDGSYVRVPTEGEAINSQEVFQRLAYEQAGTPEPV